jgi:NAD(P)-dependent dehydrogenase (short-subunit alcohol dehydrogenase family)
VFDLRDPAAIDELIAAVSDEPLDALINNAGDRTREAARGDLARRVAGDARDQRDGAVSSHESVRVEDAGRRQHRERAFDRGEDRVSELEQLLHDEVRARGFSQAVREELRPRGIRVINLYPAATNTEIWNGVEATGRARK